MNDRSRSFGVLLGLCILILGLYFSHGLYQAYWLWTLPAAAIAILFSAPSARFDLRIERYFPSAFLLIAAVSVTRGFGQLGNLQSSEPDREWLVNGFRLLYITGALCAYVCLARQRAASLFFSATVLLVSLGLVLLLFASPRPWIDVWSVQESAVTALLHGNNPYTIEYLNIYPQALQPLLNPFGNPFVYLPGVLYLLAPIKWIGLDTRIALVLAHAAATFLIGSIPNKKSYFPALVFLSIPFVPYLIDQAWNDSFTVLFIALCAFALHRKSFAWFVLSLIGMSLIKQHIFLVMPLLIYFGSRCLGCTPVKTAVYWAAGFITGCLPYAIWNWPAFVGSLWGLHSLTHASGPLMPDRQDGFSLLNWLTLNTGFRPYSTFALLGIAALAFAFTVKRKSLSTSSLFVFSSVALLGVFATAPLAFLNYYWVCIGFLICAMSFESKPIFNSWPDDVVLFSISRCLLLFSTQFFHSQTTFYNFFAAEKITTLVPLQAFGYRLMPLAQLPMAIAGYLKSLSTAPPLLSYRLYFVVLLLAADCAFYFSVRKRSRPANLFLYIIASALLFEQFYDHVELWAGLAIAFGLINESKGWLRSLGSGTTFAFQWTSGAILALCDLLFRKGTEQVAGIFAIVAATLAVAALSPVPLLQFFTRTISESNAASIANFLPLGRTFFSTYALVIPIVATLIVAALTRSRRSPLLLILTFIVFDPLAGTGALVLVLPCLALAVNCKSKLFGLLLILTCALRTLEFHELLPAVGASQLALILTYVTVILTSDWHSEPQLPSLNNPSQAL